jgi:hypothetical protein
VRPRVDARAQGCDAAHGLVTGHDAGSSGRQVALDELQVGPAHRARGDLDQDLPWPRHRLRTADRDQSLARIDRSGLGQLHRDHRAPARTGDNRVMEWIRDNIRTIGVLVVLAMLLPFALGILGIVSF